MMTNLLDLLPWIVGVAGAVTGTVIGWFSGRRKQKADAAKSELENVQKAIKIWRETAEGLEKKVDELMNELEIVRRENAELRQMHQNLKQEIKKLSNAQ